MVPLRVRYRLADGRAEAEATLGGLGIPSQGIDVGESALLVGPSYAGWAFVLRVVDLEVGESATVPIVVFGLGSWQMIALDCEVSRQEDTPVSLIGGSPVESRHYRLKVVTPIGELPGEVWTDTEGVVLRLRILISVGQVEATLEPPARRP